MKKIVSSILILLLCGCGSQQKETHDSVSCTFYSYDEAGFELHVNLHSSFKNDQLVNQTYSMETIIDDDVVVSYFYLPLEQYSNENNGINGVSQTIEKNDHVITEELRIDYSVYDYTKEIQLPYEEINLIGVFNNAKEFKKQAEKRGYKCQ